MVLHWVLNLVVLFFITFSIVRYRNFFMFLWLLLLLFIVRVFSLIHIVRICMRVLFYILFLRRGIVDLLVRRWRFVFVFKNSFYWLLGFRFWLLRRLTEGISGLLLGLFGNWVLMLVLWLILRLESKLIKMFDFFLELFIFSS